MRRRRRLRVGRRRRLLENFAGWLDARRVGGRFGDEARKRQGGWRR